jgi:2-polyprenyl-3-methyl-5-hydroxy-6-metoxy-1,4-benzoquinol methylase
MILEKPPERKKVIFIGMSCYNGVSPETLEDMMRFAFHLGRRYPEYDFFIGIRSKAEQFRARNQLVEGAIQVGADYLLMLDDDHVLEYEYSNKPTDKYDFLRKLIAHLEADQKRGIVGVLYFQRGMDCRPVLLRAAQGGGYVMYRDDELKYELQEVDVTGGGCMLCRMEIFEKIPSPWFAPEFEYGTDIQVCKATKEAGYTVWCDTSIEIGHVQDNRLVVTSKNRHKVYIESLLQGVKPGVEYTELDTSGVINLYRMDVMEYLSMKMKKEIDLEEINRMAYEYDKKYSVYFKMHPNHDDYYKSLGYEQLARQCFYHGKLTSVKFMHFIFGLLAPLAGSGRYGLDFGCGSTPTGFELAMQGHKMDFVDLDGTPAYEFTKWRAEKRGIKCGWEMKGPYDFVLMLDVIEHLENWREIMGDICNRMNDDGILVTNFFIMLDSVNPEHINMDHDAVGKFLMDRGIYTINKLFWVKTGMLR